MINIPNQTGLDPFQQNRTCSKPEVPKGTWVPHDTRDAMVYFVNRGSARPDIAVCRLIRWLGIASTKFSDWRTRSGKDNEHNGLTDWRLFSDMRDEEGTILPQ